MLSRTAPMKWLEGYLMQSHWTMNGCLHWWWCH